MFWDIQKENSPLFLKPISKKRDGFNSAWSFPEHNQIVLTTMTVSQHLARFILLPRCWSTDEDHLTSSIHITKYATTLSAKSSMDNVCFLKLAVNKSACSVQLCLQTSILLQCLPLNVWCSVKKIILAGNVNGGDILQAVDGQQFITQSPVSSNNCSIPSKMTPCAMLSNYLF